LEQKFEEFAIVSAKHWSGSVFDRLHTWLRAEKATFATFIFEKAGERLSRRHFTGSHQNEVIRQALKWCEKNSWKLTARLVRRPLSWAYPERLWNAKSLGKSEVVGAERVAQSVARHLNLGSFLRILE